MSHLAASVLGIEQTAMEGRFNIYVIIFKLFKITLADPGSGNRPILVKNYPCELQISFYLTCRISKIKFYSTNAIDCL